MDPTPPDPATIRQRAVVWAAGPDRRGRNWKYRPWVVLDDPTGETVVLLGVTTALALTPPELSVRLPSASGGHPRTGLEKPCAAVCDWYFAVEVKQIERVSGTVPLAEWNRIVVILKSIV